MWKIENQKIKEEKKVIRYNRSITVNSSREYNMVWSHIDRTEISNQRALAEQPLAQYLQYTWEYLNMFLLMALHIETAHAAVQISDFFS